jgi:hypothetical protein
MATNTVTNWFGNIVSHPEVIVDANSVDDIVAVMKDPATYPSPVRAVGSNHSTAPCGVADGGTLIRMKMNQILNIGTDSFTVQAGAVHLDMANTLRANNLQFYVNTEIGSLSAGSASCAGTKDSSFDGEYGQVGSYVTGVKMVLPSGDLLEVTDADQLDLMQRVRSSYGLFGVTYEVTYAIKPLTPMHVHHTTYSLQDFIAALPDLKALGLRDDVLHLSFRRQNHGRIPQVQSWSNGRAKPRGLGAPKPHMGNIRPQIRARHRAEYLGPNHTVRNYRRFQRRVASAIGEHRFERLHDSAGPNYSLSSGFG